MDRIGVPQQSSEFPSDVAGEPAAIWVVSSDGKPPHLMARLSSSDSAGLREMVDALDDGALLIDDSMRFVDANAAACRLTGYPIERLLGMSIENITAPAPTYDPTQLWALFQQRGSQNGRFEICAADGSIRLVSYRAWRNALPGYHLCLVQAR